MLATEISELQIHTKKRLNSTSEKVHNYGELL